jgi:hypothetical protein
VYARQVEGQLLTFGVSGKLIMNGLVMYDRETGSLWSQVIGQAVDGRFQGVELGLVAGLQTTWGKWVTAHPDTLVLDKGGSYRSDSYTRYYSDGRLGILGQKRGDTRVPSKEFVVGVTIDGRAKAYPFQELGNTPVVNDLFNEVPLLVTFDSPSATGVVFSPVMEGRHLTFQEIKTSDEFLIEDLETGTVWDPLTGAAREEPLAGTALERVASHYEFWFAWKDYRPDTELYQSEAADANPS